MSEVNEITVNVDEYLAIDKYEVDEESAHIELVDDPGDEEFLKLVRVCPAALYKIDEDGKKSFDYAGCLECGTCRIACEGTIVKKWETPGPRWAWSTGSGRRRAACAKRTVPSAISYIWRRSLIAHARYSSAPTSASPMTKPAFCWNWARLSNRCAPARLRSS